LLCFWQTKKAGIGISTTTHKEKRMGKPVEGFRFGEIARNPDKIRYGLRLLMASRDDVRSSELLAKAAKCSPEDINLLLTSPENTTVHVFTAVCCVLRVTPNELIGDFEIEEEVHPD